MKSQRASTPPPSVAVKTDTIKTETIPKAPPSGKGLFPRSTPSLNTKSSEQREDSGLHHAEFFAPPPPRMPHGMGMDDDLDEPQLRVFSAEAKERRKKNVRVVKWFVGGCLALTAIAAVRHATRTEEPPPPPSVSAAQTSATPPEPAAQTAPTPSSASPTASATVATADDAATSSASTMSDAGVLALTATEDASDRSTQDAGASTDASSASSSSSDPEEAKQERNRAKRALESGRLKEAVTAGEHAVTLDPTDADAWLYLGAAYQELGDQGNANRCYRACLAQGTHGNKGECSMMMK